MGKIYTKKGDGGFAMGPDGMSHKSDPVFWVLGTIDELQANMGMLYELLNVYDDGIDELREDLKAIMDWLYKTSGMIFKNMDFIDDSYTEQLEAEIDNADKKLQPLNRFILPIGGKPSAQAHITRTVCRRLERSFFVWDATGRRPRIAKFLNRLSDYLFIVARMVEKEEDSL
jgi:cob(I)alamin adenosyltransferase